MSKRYPPQFFLDLFEPIPAKKWQTKALGSPGGLRCAVGHIRGSTGDEFNYGPKNKMRITALGTIIAKTLEGKSTKLVYADAFDAVVNVNDFNADVKASGPKQRILKVLKTAIKKGIV